MTTKVAPDGTPEATDVWRRYRTDGALASACVRTRSERDETARVREQVRPIESIRARIRRFGVAMVDARRRRDARARGWARFETKRNETRRKKGWVTDSRTRDGVMRSWKRREKTRVR